MKTIVFNDDNLTNEDIKEQKIKARAIIVNDSNELLLSHYAGLYMLPGGKVDKGEDILQGLVREIREETGILLSKEQITPFLFLRYFVKDYPVKNSINSLKNKLTDTYYFIVKVKDNINLNKTQLTENEVQGNFEMLRVKLNKVISLIEQNNSNNVRNSYFSRELTTVVEAYEKVLYKKRTKEIFK